jgi:hypothetical protein
MDCFMSLPNTAFSYIFLEFLSLKEFGVWDSAITNKSFRENLKFRTDGWSASKWQIKLDLINIELHKKMLVWFSDRKLLKHERLTISSITSTDKINEIFGELNLAYVFTIRIVDCNLSNCEDNSNCEFCTIMNQFVNLLELNLENCSNVNDVRLNGINKLLKKITNFKMIHCNQGQKSRRFEILDYFLNISLRKFTLTGSYLYGNLDPHFSWSAAVAQRFVSKRISTLQLFDCGDTTIEANTNLFFNFINAPNLYEIIMNNIDLLVRYNSIPLFNPYDITMLLNNKPDISLLKIKDSELIFQFWYVNNDVDRKLFVTGASCTGHKRLNKVFQGFEIGKLLSFNNNIRNLTLDYVIISSTSLGLIEKYFANSLMFLCIANCQLLCSYELFITFVKKFPNLKSVKLGSRPTDCKLTLALRELGLIQ